MTKEQRNPEPLALEDALQLCRLMHAKGPVCKTLLCYDHADKVWCVVDCMQANEIAWLCWRPELKPISLATSPALNILLPCEDFSALESLMITAFLDNVDSGALLDLILIANRLPYFIGAMKGDNGVQSEPPEVHNDDGGAVSDQ